jgi:Domain of Unknown Function (DUF1206)
MSGLELNEAGTAATAAVREAGESKWVDRLARVGLAARGLVYLIIAVLAGQIAFGDRSQRADEHGAFQTLAQNGWGKAVLWVAVVGFLGYALWLATDALWGHRGEPERLERVAAKTESAGKVVFYVFLAILALQVVTGGNSSGGETLTADVLGMTGGQVLVVVAGAVVIGIAAVQVWRGVKASFTRHLDLARLSPTARRGVVAFGRVGYFARGIVFALVGVLVIAAALTFDPDKARGFDAALREFAGQPYGPWLLTVIAVGLGCFGAYSFAEARFRRL